MRTWAFRLRLCSYFIPSEEKTRGSSREVPGRSDRVPRPARRPGAERRAGCAPRLGRRRRAAGGARAPPPRKERGGGGCACGAAGLRRSHVHPVPRVGQRRDPPAMPAALP